MGLVLT